MLMKYVCTHIMIVFLTSDWLKKWSIVMQNQIKISLVLALESHYKNCAVVLEEIDWCDPSIHPVWCSAQVKTIGPNAFSWAERKQGISMGNANQIKISLLSALEPCYKSSAVVFAKDRFFIPFHFVSQSTILESTVTQNNTTFLRHYNHNKVLVKYTFLTSLKIFVTCCVEN